jgi:flagellar biosynthesis protein FliR
MYLAIIGLGLFGEAAVRGSLVVAGDAAATASNIIASQSLWRTGIATDLLMHVLDVPLIVFFYLLLKPVSYPLALLATVAESLTWLPPGSPVGSFLASRSPVQLGAELFSLGLSLALPFMAMLLFVNVAMGIVSRVAPQLNLFAVGFPVTILVGIAMLTVGLPMIEAPLAVQLDRLLVHLGR